MTLIHRAERLPEILRAIGRRLGGLTVLPVIARAGKPATRILLWGRKGARAPFTLAAPLVLHAGARHLRDGEDYTPEVSAILRNAAPLLAIEG